MTGKSASFINTPPYYVFHAQRHPPPPDFIGDPPILEKQRQIRPEHNNL